ncbi:class I SAM-dependent methyltransferase [Terriglobus sp.]|uniref:class I SAM-dependent methyltransferase n=1 Tax=Terriglobus sp. TaxID=1889013 RepID=UPI003B006244
MGMMVNGPDPLTTSEEHADLHYGKSYLGWKGWDDDNFAKVSRAEIFYFDAELRRAGFKPTSQIRVLEIGFGNGSFLAYAKTKGWNAIGTEVNDFLVEMATRRGLYAIHALDLNALDDGAFDLVVAFDVLEHIPQNYLLDFVKSLVRKLKPGGLFIARFPNADSPFGLLNQNGDMTHLTALGLGKVRYLSRELGMRVVFFGGQAVPLIRNEAFRSLRRIAGLALFKVVDIFVNKVFYPNDPIAFCSSNVVMVLQATR